MNLPMPVAAAPICALVLLGGLRGDATAADVNPLTGAPLSLEQMHWTLEQARLEEQLQASLLNRRKFELERQRLDTAPAQPPLAAVALPASLHVPPEPRRGAPPVAAGVEVPDRTRAPAPLHPAARRTRAVAPQRPVAAPPWDVVGVRTQGAQWCLLVAEAAQLWPVCPGDWRRGHHVDQVGAADYTVDGLTFALEVPVTHLQRGAGEAATRVDADPAGPGHPAGEAVAEGAPLMPLTLTDVLPPSEALAAGSASTGGPGRRLPP